LTPRRRGRSLRDKVAERDLKKVQKQLVADQAKPVPLHVAASVVYQQLSGATRERTGENAILDSTALALSHVADIYYLTSDHKLRRIPEEELAVGMFEAGATIFRARSGNVYESLSIRRGDMAEAIAILQNARGALRNAADAERSENKA
jgi:hypothetical protein